MSFSAGRRSIANLEGVRPELVDVIKMAYVLTECDFSVVDGVRSLETQKKYFETGKSQTMKSKHLIQTDGFGWAVDLYPWFNGKTSHNEKHYFQVLAAINKAAIEFGVNIRYGCFFSSFKETGNDGVVRYGDRCHIEYAR